MEKKAGNNLQFVLLCGGQSIRMGHDKGLLVKQKLTWAEWGIQLLKSFTDQIILSIKQQQVLSYKKLLTSNPYIIDSLNIPGPLNGILSVHSIYPNNDLFVLACDMIKMTRETIDILINKYIDNDSYSAFLYERNNRLEPLCGIYTSSGLEIINEYIQTTFELQMKDFGIVNCISLLNAMKIPIPPHQMDDFRNMNTLKDLSNNE